MSRKQVNVKRHRGSATLELAVMLPLLMTIGLISVDFGRFAHTHIAVTNAARAGAGLGSMHRVTPSTQPIWEAAIRLAVENELANNGWFDAQQLTMNPAPQSIVEANGMSRVQVTVSYPFQTLINWPFLPGYNDPFILTRTVVMRLVR